MTLPRTEPVRCPGCDHTSNYHGFATLNVSLNPELKKRLLEGDLFKFSCPSCAKTFNFHPTLLYHDEVRRAMLWLTQTGPDGMPHLEPGTDTAMARVMSGYQLRVMDDPTQLLEKIRLLDDGLDDITVEMVKALYASKRGVALDRPLYYHHVQTGSAGDATLFLEEPSSDGSHYLHSLPWLTEAGEAAAELRSLLEERFGPCLWVSRTSVAQAMRNAGLLQEAGQPEKCLKGTVMQEPDTFTRYAQITVQRLSEAAPSRSSYWQSSPHQQERAAALHVFNTVAPLSRFFFDLVEGLTTDSTLESPHLVRALSFPHRFRSPANVASTDARTSGSRLRDTIATTFYLGLLSHLFLMTYRTRTDPTMGDVNRLRAKWLPATLMADIKMQPFNERMSGLPWLAYEHHFRLVIAPFLKLDARLSWWARIKCKSFFRNVCSAGMMLSVYHDFMTNGLLDDV